MKTQEFARIREMLNTHPDRPEGDVGILADCVEATLACAQTCTACADACLHEASPEKLRYCIRLNLDCADVCESLGRMLSRASRPDADTMRGILQTCVAACTACAEECDKHASMHEHCRICAEACRACEQTCQSLLDVTPV